MRNSYIVLFLHKPTLTLVDWEGISNSESGLSEAKEYADEWAFSLTNRIWSSHVINVKTRRVVYTGKKQY